MSRTTLKTIRTMILEGIATDITNLPDNFLRNLATNDRPECIMASSGTYGINGAILRGRETGKLYAINGRCTTLFYFI